jgi:mobilization protein NikA
MARPKKAESEKRSANFPPVRVTEAELIHVQDQAEMAGLSVSDYLRQRALSGKVTPRRTSGEASLLVELNRVGVNLNQIARALNGGRDEDPHHIGFVLHELHGVMEKLAAD